MSEQIPRNTNQPEQVFFLSEILGAKVIFRKARIGKLSDVVIVETGKVPEVTYFCVARPFGNPSLLIPWRNVWRMATKEIVIDIENIEPYEHEPGPDAVLLRDHILDKRVLDTEDRDVEMVYDVKLVLRGDKLYVSDVDVSRYGLLRRIGLKGLANFISMLAERVKDQTISWTYIQPLPTQMSSFKGDVKLKVLKEKLSEIHPVDLADIFEEMEPEQRTKIFDQLETSHASDILEEIDPNVQRDLVTSLNREKVARLIDEMTPGQAADILSALPASQANDLMELFKEERATKIQSILQQQEQKILNYATSRFLTIAPDKTAGWAQAEYPRLSKGKIEIMYFYVVDEQDKLLGVLDIKELLQANDNALIKDVMITQVISLTPESTLREAFAIFSRYSFRAIPIVDESEKILGVLTYRDVMGLKHRFLE